MTSEWLSGKIDDLKTSSSMLKEMWDKMGVLSKKKPSDIALEDLKEQAADLSCDIFKESINQINLISQTINTPDIEQELANTLSDIKTNTETIITDTKDLASESDVDESVIEALGEWQAIAEESGNFKSGAKFLEHHGLEIEIEFESKQIEIEPSAYMETSLQDVITTAIEISDIADSMNELVNSDPRELILDTVKEELGDKITSTFGPLNSVTAGISSIVASALDNYSGDFSSLDELGKSCIDSAKGFAANKLSDVVTSNTIEVFDLQNLVSADGGSLHGLANTILETAKSCLSETINDHIAEKALNKLGGSASGLTAAAESVISVSQQDPRSLDLSQVKDSFSDKLADSFGPINSIAGYASQLSETDGLSGSLSGSLGDISKFTEDAVSQIQTAAESAEIPQDAMDSFNLMQDVAKSGGKLQAYGYGILALVEEGEAEASAPSLLEELAGIKQGANDLLSNAESLWDMTQKDPRETILDELKNQVSSESEKIMAPMSDISDSTSRALATGLLTGSLSSVFDKIKENVAKAESSQSELKSTAQPASQADSAPSEKTTDKDTTTETASDDSSSSETARAADQNSSESGSATESTAADAATQSSSENGSATENSAANATTQSSSESDSATTDAAAQGSSESGTATESTATDAAAQGSSESGAATESTAADAADAADQSSSESSQATENSAANATTQSSSESGAATESTAADAATQDSSESGAATESTAADAATQDSSESGSATESTAADAATQDSSESGSATESTAADAATQGSSKSGAATESTAADAATQDSSESGSATESTAADAAAQGSSEKGQATESENQPNSDNKLFSNQSTTKLKDHKLENTKDEGIISDII